MFITVSVVPGWLLTIAKSLHCMDNAVTNGFIFNYDPSRSFGYSVNVLRNFIDITWAMFVTVCVVCTGIVGVTRFSMAWL